MSVAEFEIQFQIHPKPGMVPPTGTASQGQTGRLPRITQVLALAIHLDEMIRSGEAKDYADLARLGCLSRERVSQIMRLLSLAPDIQVEITYLPPTPTGRYPLSETAARKVASILDWAEQRNAWAGLNHAKGLGEGHTGTRTSY